MRERLLEQKLRNEVKAKDGLALKFVSPGMAGVPDRIVLTTTKYTTEFIVQNKACGCLLDLGMGKSVITLTAIDELLDEVNKVLVIAPLRVAEDTWSKECEKWDHLKHLRITKVLGSKKHGLVLWDQ